MSNIPEARRILLDSLDTMPAPWRGQVERALALMTRRPLVKPRAPSESRPVDAALASRIRAHVAARPDDPLQDVAARFNVNIGRVSEAIHHDR